jgi:hypothetical protein
MGRKSRLHLETGAWRTIAEQLVTEPDTEKVLALVQQLNKELDREDSVGSPIKLL